MSREDYISKLFRRNASKLESEPSDDLWGRIEQQLDKSVPVPNKGQTRVLAMSRYIAAASVLLLVGVSAWLLTEVDQNKLANNTAPKVALETLALDMEEETTPIAETPEEPEVLNAVEAEEVFEAEDATQGVKIIKALKDKLPNPAAAKDFEIEDIEIADRAVVLEEVPMEPALVQAPNVELEELEESIKVLKGREKRLVEATPNMAVSNYASPSNVHTQEQKETLKRIESIQKSTAKVADAKEEKVRVSKTRKSRTKLKRRRLGLGRRKSKDVQPMHQQIKLFSFLLGKWEDTNEPDGTGFEVWSLKDKNTLSGLGYKSSEEGDRLFSEQMVIRYDNQLNKVFLEVAFEEGGTKIKYILNSLDVERLVFSQNDSKDFPSEIALLRERIGFTWVLTDPRQAISVDLQRYLDNRNRVSNIKATRTLSPVE